MMRVYKIPEFDYDGERSISWYDEVYDRLRMRYVADGGTALAGANWDLQCMTQKWKRTRDATLEPIIRSQVDVIEDIMNGGL